LQQYGHRIQRIAGYDACHFVLYKSSFVIVLTLPVASGLEPIAIRQFF